VSKVELKLNAVIESKDRSIESLSTTYQNLYTTIQAHKSTSHKGKEGEQLFQYYADETFKDFKGYNLIDKHTQGGAGDFHMLFEDFDVLVDAKNYKKKVPIEQRDKIKKDLIKNEHIPFAWLVSLNTSIDKYDKAPVMYEWINTKQCIVYINNLTEYEDPRKILRVVWFTCKELNKFVEDINVDNEELQELKNDKFKLMDKIKNMRKTMREINTTLNTTRNMLQLIDDEFKEILSSETEKLVESNYSMFDDWWDTNIEVTNEDEKILSTDLWFKFKQDNKTSMKEFDVTTDKFKQFIKAKVPMQSIILKSKNANSAFEIKGIKWKSVEKIVEAKPIENLLVSEVPKKKTVKKIKSPEVYFDEEKDKTIIEDYIVSNDDIMIIANRHNIKTFQIVSLLVRYKIIAKRSESRGYDKYKETEEYKSKIQY
jgi:prefoldin subunit 5